MMPLRISSDMVAQLKNKHSSAIRPTVQKQRILPMQPSAFAYGKYSTRSLALAPLSIHR
jgi:hypothetical protein